MPTPAKKKPVKNITAPTEIEVKFVVGFDKDGKYEVREIGEDDDPSAVVREEFFIDTTSFRVCRVYLTPPRLDEPLILVPQNG